MLKWLPQTSGRVYALRLDGPVSDHDCNEIRAKFEHAIRLWGRIQVFAVLEGVEDIPMRSALRNLRFSIRHLRDFDRLAIVGDRRWKKYLMPLIRADYRQFDSGREGEALHWILADQGNGNRN